MPIYEYACPKCGEFEITQRITDEPLKKCPTCKSAKVKKLMSSTSFQLKGSGWYVTDYARKDAGGDKPSADGKNEGKSDGKSEGKSDSKSEGKSDGKRESKSDSKSESKSDSKSESKSESGTKESSSKSSDTKSSGKTEKASQAA